MDRIEPGGLAIVVIGVEQLTVAVHADELNFRFGERRAGPRPGPLGAAGSGISVLVMAFGNRAGWQGADP